MKISSLVLTLGFYFSLAIQCFASEDHGNNQINIIRQELKQHNVADLRLLFKDSRDRIIGSDVLRYLLSDSVYEDSKMIATIIIKNADVKDEITYEGLNVNHTVQFDSCHFRENINFANTKFAGDLVFTNSAFDKIVYLPGITVNGNLLIKNCECAWMLELSRAAIKGVLDGSYSRFNRMGQTTMMNRISVGNDVIIDNASIYSSIEIRGADIVGRLEMNRDTTFNKDGNINLEAIEIHHELFIRNSWVHGGLNVQRGKIGGLIDFSYTKFFNEDKVINLNLISTQSDLICLNGEFFGPLDLSNAFIGNICDMAECVFHSKHSINFANSRFNSTLIINDAIFGGGVDFSNIEVGNVLLCERAVFQNKSAMIIFNEAKIYCAMLDSSKFYGPVDCEFMTVKTLLSGEHIQFNGQNKINMKSISVGKDMDLGWSTFEGNVTFDLAEISNRFIIEHSRFLDSSGDITLCGLRSNLIFINYAEFYGGANFRLMSATGFITANKAHFYNRTANVCFHSVYAENMFQVDSSEFFGPVDLSLLTTHGVINLFNTKFLYNSMPLNLHALRGGRNIYISDVRVDGGIDMTSTEAQDMTIENISKPCNMLNLTTANVGGTISIENSEIDTLLLESIVTCGRLAIKNVSIQKVVSLGYSRFDDLYFENDKWPGPENKIFYTGAIFKSIRIGSSDEGTEILKWVHLGIYDADIYKQVDDMLRKRGYSDAADKLFIENSEHQRTNIVMKVLWALIGQGKRIYNLLYFSLGIIIVGWIFFRPKWMASISLANGRKDFSPLTYSVDIFLPFINLHMEDTWIPNEKYKYLQIWMRIQTIIGWLCTTVLLVLWTGIVK
jgi:hypothetical protein